MPKVFEIEEMTIKKGCRNTICWTTSMLEIAEVYLSAGWCLYLKTNANMMATTNA